MRTVKQLQKKGSAMKKVICKISDDEVISDINRQMDMHINSAMARLDMFRIQARKIEKETNELKELLWKKLEDYLESKNMLPSDYRQKEYNLNLDNDLGLLIINDKEEDQLAAILKKIIK